MPRSHRNSFHPWDRTHLCLCAPSSCYLWCLLPPFCPLAKACSLLKPQFKCHLIQKAYPDPLINCPFFWTLSVPFPPQFHTVFITPLFILFMPLFVYLSLQWDIKHTEKEDLVVSLYLCAPNNVLTISAVQSMLGFNCFCNSVKILFSFSSICLCPCCCSLCLGYLLPSPTPFSTQISYSSIKTSPVVRSL